MSMIMDVDKRFAHWRILLAGDMERDLLVQLEMAPRVEVAEFLATQCLEECVQLLLLLRLGTQASLFESFDVEKQLEIYNKLPRAVFANLFEHMSSDLRADFYLRLNEQQRIQLLPYLSKKVRRDVITLSAYPASQAGGIMNTDFVVVHEDITVAEALNKIREESPSKKMMYFLYLVDHARKLVGIVDLKDLILAKPEMKVRELAEKTIVYAYVDEDREKVANKIEKYGFMALPVLNNDEQLVGIVNYEDAIDVIREEDTEDMEKFMGILVDSNRSSYLSTPSMQHFKQRVGWVSGLFILSVLSSLVIHSFQDTINQWSFLAIYIPMISDVGGNVGSQAATMVIRALALQEISLKNWLSIVYKEAKVALLLASSLFMLCLLKVSFLAHFFEHRSYGTAFLISLTIAAAITIQVVTATLIGALLPLLIKKLGKDPALAASPAITTVVDISGMLIYFGSAKLIFSHFSVLG